MNLFAQLVLTEFDGSQAAAGRALGIGRSMVSRLSRGERQVSPALAQRIQEATGGRFQRDAFIWPESSAPAPEARDAA